VSDASSKPTAAQAVANAPANRSGSAEATFESTDDLGNDIDFGEGLSEEEREAAAAALAKEGEGDDDQQGEDPPKEEAQDDDAEASDYEALPDFDAAKPEVLSAYDSRFYNDAGELDRDALTAEWNANAKPGEDGQLVGELNEGTYAYLQHRLGLPKDTVKEIEAALSSRNANAGDALVTASFGSKDNYQEALKWAREGGYDKAGQKRYNAALKRGGQDAQDALDALAARYVRATGKAPLAPAQSKTNLPAGRPVNAKRELGRGTPATPAAADDVFSSMADYRSALREAGNDRAKIEAARAKLRRSNTKGWAD
jgi:hypothetical protein